MHSGATDVCCLRPRPRAARRERQRSNSARGCLSYIPTCQAHTLDLAGRSKSRQLDYIPDGQTRLHDRRGYARNGEEMPRKSKGARLYFDTTRGEWVIRDGTRFQRTGCPEGARLEAEQKLGEYIGEKYKPQQNSAPSIAEVLLAYWNEHLSHGASKRANKSTITNLTAWWGEKLVSDITPENCRAYVAQKGEYVVAARRDLQSLKAAVNHWHKSEYGPLDRLPVVLMPPAPDGRQRWLTRDEIARLLWAARRTPHLRRFILISYYTGSRSAAVRELEWMWIDFNASTMRRRAPGKAEQKNKRRPLVRLGNRILSHLRRWKRLDGPHAKYVVHYDGQPIRRELRHSWHRAVKLAELDGEVIPHTLRHSRATRLMQAGSDPFEAAGSLGMSVQTLLRTYGHHHPDFPLRRYVDNICSETVPRNSVND